MNKKIEILQNTLTSSLQQNFLKKEDKRKEEKDDVLAKKVESLSKKVEDIIELISQSNANIKVVSLKIDELDIKTQEQNFASKKSDEEIDEQKRLEIVEKMIKQQASLQEKLTKDILESNKKTVEEAKAKIDNLSQLKMKVDNFDEFKNKLQGISDLYIKVDQQGKSLSDLAHEISHEFSRQNDISKGFSKNLSKLAECVGRLEIKLDGLKQQRNHHLDFDGEESIFEPSMIKPETKPETVKYEPIIADM